MSTEGRKTKIDFLEKMFQRYADMPREVIVKEDVLREGVVVKPEAVGDAVRAYQLFSWEKQGAEKAEAQPTRVPDYFEMEGGLYSLRPTQVRTRSASSSPYSIELKDGKPALCAEGMPVAMLWPFQRRPAYFDKQFPDGTRYGDVVTPPGPTRQAYVVAFNSCQYWGQKEECRFCDINENYRAKKAMGLRQVKPFKDPVQVGEVLDEMFHREQWEPGYGPSYVFLNGGSITDKLDGVSETEFYLRYVREARAKLGTHWPVYLQMRPKPRAVVRQFREAGLTHLDCNMEVWDKRLFEWICPGKSREPGRDEWLRMTIEAVEEMGYGQVGSNFVAGVEMARPHGFTTVKEAVNSTREGFETLMKNGVIAKHGSWNASRLSFFRDQPTPPLEYFIEIDRAWYETWVKYKVPMYYAGTSPVGPGVGLYANSAFVDMAWERH